MGKTKISINLPHLFKPYPHQVPLYEAMIVDESKGEVAKKRAVIVYHRRGGKDLTCWNIMLAKAGEKRGVYYYIFPSYAQARKAFWDNITEDGRSYRDFAPREYIEKVWQNEMKMKLITGSLIQVLGSDNPDALRGTNPAGVVLSEYAYQNPLVWTAILDPILHKNKGWAIFNSTPNGRNHFYDLYEYAKTDPDWYAGLFNIVDTGLISEDEIKHKEKQGLSPELIAQEYMCSFSSGVVGSYYGRHLEKAKAEGRTTYVPYDDMHLVYTAWDIGFSDSTCIVFYQVIGNAIHIIDFYENNGYSLAHYLGILRSKEYQYGTHFFPHDGKQRSVATGKNLLQIANESEYNFEVIPSKMSVMDGIEKVRGLFKRFFFDKDKCEFLLRCLQEYHADYNEKAQVFSQKPSHNWSSHAADCVRVMALALDLRDSDRLSEKDAEELERTHRRNFNAYL